MTASVKRMERIDDTDGDVMHIRIPSDIKEALKLDAQIEGRAMTQHVIAILDEHLFGSRKLRVATGKWGKN